MNKKILIISNNISGLYRFRREVIEALVQKGCQVIISTPDAEIKKHFINLGCQFIPTNFERKGKNPLEQLSLILHYRKIIKQHKPDVVLTYTVKPNILGGIACRMCHTPMMANVTGLGTSIETSGWKEKLMVGLLRMGLKKAKVVFFQNEENLQFIQKHHITDGKKILIPGSGVNLTYHTIQDYPPAHPLRFVFISRLRKEKGIGQYLQAADHLKKKYSDVEFHVVGPCEEDFEKTLQEYKDKGAVIYHGWVMDVRPILKEMHCTVHPSYYPEGMSNVLLESSAAGRPIITTDKSGCREVVEHGKTGYMVKQKSVDDLIEKMEAFINLPYETKKEMGLAARRKVEKEFDRNVVISAYINEINSL